MQISRVFSKFSQNFPSREGTCDYLFITIKGKSYVCLAFVAALKGLHREDIVREFKALKNFTFYVMNK